MSNDGSPAPQEDRRALKGLCSSANSLFISDFSADKRDSDSIEEFTLPTMRKPAEDTSAANFSRKQRPELPCDLWALVVENLTYQDVMQCAVVSPFFLHQVLRAMQTLVFTSASQLHPNHARRFATGHVKYILIQSYVSRHPERPQRQLRLCQRTAMLVVPFLAQFPDLEYVFVGGEDLQNPLSKLHTHRGWYYRLGLFYDPTLDTRALPLDAIHRGLIGSFCGALQFGVLPPNLQLYGLFDIYACRSIGHGDCHLCTSICQSISMSQVLHHLEPPTRLCVGRAKRIQILRQRKGGLEFLQDPRCLLEMLQVREEHRIGPMTVVRYSQSSLNDMKELKALGCNPRGLDFEDMVDSIFAVEGKCGAGPPHTRHIDLTSFRALVSLGFPLQEQDCFRVQLTPRTSES